MVCNPNLSKCMQHMSLAYIVDPYSIEHTLMAAPCSQLFRSQLPVPVPTMILLLLLAVASDHFILAAAAKQPPPPIARPGCRDKCGSISVPFPFGIGPGCFLAHQFEVYCNDSSSPPRAFLASTSDTYQLTGEAGISNASAPFRFNETAISPSPIEVIDISVDRNEVRAYGAVSSYCTKSEAEQVLKLQRTAVAPYKTLWPLTVSMERNALVGVGMDVEARLGGSMYMDLEGEPSQWFSTSCTSAASLRRGRLYQPVNGSCSGFGCCEAPFAGRGDRLFLPQFAVSFKPENTTHASDDWKQYPCSYGMVVESSWYNFSTPDLYGYEVLPKRLQRGVPFVIDFSVMTDQNGSCPGIGQQPPPGYACASDNSFCTNVSTEAGGSYSYVCECTKYYEGNPYITNGCQDIDECKRPDLYPCSSNGVCKNRLGGYDCPCKRGMKGDGKAGTCKDIIPLVAKVIVGALGLILLMVILFLIILRKEKRKMREFYRKNGGPILEKAKIIKLFKKEELKPILKSDNFIGKGGFGEVYRGHLHNQLVAVKKPISGSVLEIEQFANEVIIQSQVIHKNIVRLIGCCLEVDIPMLVYEFLSKGSLDDILHSDNKVPINLDMRLRIAAESADGLAYMHSKTTTKILHGDVKSANILLDDNFMPKISDFGISRLIQRDKQHTLSIIGDKSYMDPIYLQTGLLTEKSDVYSFGVVILELISRKKATHSDNNSLVRSFLEAHKKEKKATEYFDNEIAKAGELELLDSLTEMAVECLNLDVDQRPTMTEVAERLLKLSRSRGL
ncbi:unnamed protein product [Urochloa decumbens]|uniref:Uncharacterized protein n=1 Tax=Urochloa decumbens TaxID=240449 RepID=A0ABC9B534_9POAL